MGWPAAAAIPNSIPPPSQLTLFHSHFVLSSVQGWTKFFESFQVLPLTGNQLNRNIWRFISATWHKFPFSTLYFSSVAVLVVWSPWPSRHFISILIMLYNESKPLHKYSPSKGGRICYRQPRYTALPPFAELLFLAHQTSSPSCIVAL